MISQPIELQTHMFYKLSNSDLQQLDFYASKILRSGQGKPINFAKSWRDIEDKDDFRRIFFDTMEMFSDKITNLQSQVQRYKRSQKDLENYKEFEKYLFIIKRFNLVKDSMLDNRTEFKPDQTDYLIDEIISKINQLQEQQVSFVQLKRIKAEYERKTQQLSVYQKVISYINQPKLLKTMLNQKETKLQLSFKQVEELNKVCQKSNQIIKLKQVLKYYQNYLCEINDQLKKKEICFDPVQKIIQIQASKLYSVKNQAEKKDLISANICLKKLITNIKNSKTQITGDEINKTKNQTFINSALKKILKSTIIAFQSKFEQKPFSNLLEIVVQFSNKQKQVQNYTHKLIQLSNKQRRLREFKQAVGKIDVNKIQTFTQPVRMIKQLQSKQFSFSSILDSSRYTNKELLKQYLSEFQNSLAHKIVQRMAKDCKENPKESCLHELIKEIPLKQDSSLKKAIKDIIERKQKQTQYLRSVKHKLNNLLGLIANKKLKDPNMNPNDINFYFKMELITQQLHANFGYNQQNINKFQKNRKKPKEGFEQFQQVKQKQKQNNLDKEDVQKQQSEMKDQIKILQQRIEQLNKKLKQSQTVTDQLNNKNIELQFKIQKKKQRNIQLQRKNSFLQGQISSLKQQKQRQLKQQKQRHDKQWKQRQLQLRQQKDNELRKVQDLFIKQKDNYQFSQLQYERKVRNLNQQLDKYKQSQLSLVKQTTISDTQLQSKQLLLQSQQQKDKLIKQFIIKLVDQIKEIVQSIDMNIKFDSNKNKRQKVSNYQHQYREFMNKYKELIQLLIQNTCSFINQFNKYLLTKISLSQIQSSMQTFRNLIGFASNNYSEQKESSNNGASQNGAVDHNMKGKQQYVQVTRQQLMTDKEKLEQELRKVNKLLDQHKSTCQSLQKQKEQLQLIEKQHKQTINKMAEQIQTLKCQLDQKQRLLEKQVQTKSKLQDQLIQMKQNLQLLNNNNNNSKDNSTKSFELQRLKQTLQNLQRLNQQLNSEKHLINKKLTSLQQNNQQQSNKLRQVQKQKRSLQQRLRELSNNINKVTDQKNQLMNNMNKQDQSITQISRLTNKISQLSDEKNLLICKIDNLEHQKTLSISKVSQLENSNKQLIDSNNQLKSQNHLLKTQNSQLNLLNAQLTNSNSSLISEKEQQKIKIKQLSVQLQTYKSQIQILKQQHQQLKSQHQQLKQSSPSSSQKTSTTKPISSPVSSNDKNSSQLINSLRSQLQTQRRQHKQTKSKLIGIQCDIDQLQQDKSKLYNKYKTNQQQITQLKKEIIQFKQSQQLLVKQKILQVQIQFQQQIKSRQSQLKQQHQQKLNQINIQLQQQSSLLQLKQQQINKLSTQLQSKSQSIQTLQSQSIQTLQSKTSQLHSKINQLSKELTQNKKTIEQTKKSHNKQLKQLRLQHARTVQNIKKQYHVEKYKQKLSINSSNNSENFSVRERMEYQKVKSELDKQKHLHKKSVDTKLKQIQTLNKYIMSLEQSIDNLSKIIDQQKHQINTYRQIVQSNCNEKQSLTPNNGQKPNIKQNIIFDRFFAGYAMEDQFDKKYQLLNLIQQKINKKVQKTRLLYKYDLKNSNNFHNYTDGYDNFLLIVKTTKNIFGVFSTSRIEKGYVEPKDTKAFIFTFSNPEKITSFDYSFKKSKGGKTLTYDEFFLVVGNSQIRLRFGQKIVYSNFAINNAFYENNGTNVSALLMNKDSRQADLVGYECFQVIFE